MALRKRRWAFTRGYSQSTRYPFLCLPTPFLERFNMASLVLPWKSGRSVGPVVLFTAAGCSPAWNFPFFFRGGHPESLVFHYYIYIYRSIIIVIYNYIYIHTENKKNTPRKPKKLRNNKMTRPNSLPLPRCGVQSFFVCVFFLVLQYFFGEKSNTSKQKIKTTT